MSSQQRSVSYSVFSFIIRSMVLEAGWPLGPRAVRKRAVETVPCHGFDALDFTMFDGMPPSMRVVICCAATV
jgi:hypothetical protein